MGEGGGVFEPFILLALPKMIRESQSSLRLVMSGTERMQRWVASAI